MNNLASERVRIGATQEDVAEKIGVSKQSISLWEQGKAEMGSESLRKLSTLFGCSADYLLGIKEERK